VVSGKKQIQQLARTFFKLSVVDGVVSPEHVAGVLAYVDKHRPPHSVAILRAYERLIAGQIARSRAIVEHAGPLNNGVTRHIAEAMSRRYGRRIDSVPRRNDGLIAGVRVRVGDDVYESTVAGQLAALANSV
jgi:F-type H+-transporting ATPase subunit delta